MASSVFNKEKGLDFTKQPMFFGEDLQVQRYDSMKYPIFDKLTQQQLGFFWRPEEVSLQKDRNDYQSLGVEQKHIFTSNLKYQTMLDSVQGRGPCLAFLPFCSLPELEGAIITWDFMETIHSRSYTYIIKNLYSQPSDVFDTIIQDEKIEKRSKSVTKTYDELISLKGVGDYTASAILSIAYDQPYPAIDGNLKRVIARLYGVKDSKHIIKESKRYISILMKNHSPSIINQSLMDLSLIHI